MNKKILIVPALALSVGLLMHSSAPQAQAFSFGEAQQSLIAKIAERFGLNQDEVQTVVTQQRQEFRAQRHTEMQARFSERLDEAVSNGELTEDQRQTIEQKHEGLRTTHEQEMEDRQNMSREQWRETRESHHAEMEQWADDNGIDMKYFMRGMKDHMRGMGRYSY